MLMIFSVDARHHGAGPVKYKWDPHGSYVASSGSSRVAHIFSRRGKLVDQVVPPSPRFASSSPVSGIWGRRRSTHDVCDL